VIDRVRFARWFTGTLLVLAAAGMPLAGYVLGWALAR
jgi:hypothetical protein